MSYCGALRDSWVRPSAFLDFYSSPKILSLEETENHRSYSSGNDTGPFGERDDQQVFIQKVVPSLTSCL